MPVKQGGICETGESINQNGLSMVWPQAPWTENTILFLIRLEMRAVYVSASESEWIETQIQVC